MVSILSHRDPSSFQVSWNSVEEFLCNPADKPCDKHGTQVKTKKGAIKSTRSLTAPDCVFWCNASNATVLENKHQKCKYKSGTAQTEDQTKLLTELVSSTRHYELCVMAVNTSILDVFFIYKCQQQYQSSVRLWSTFHCSAAVLIQITVHYFISTYCKWAY